MTAPTRTIALLGVALLLCGLSATAQPIGETSPENTVFFDAIPFAAPLQASVPVELDSQAIDSGATSAPPATETVESTVALIDLYVAIPYAALEFERSDGVFLGSYQATLQIEGSDGTKLLDTTFSRTVRTASYAMSTGSEPGYEFYQHRQPVPSGRWIATLELLDLRTNRSMTIRRSVETVDHREHPFSLSGLLLVRRIREDSTGFVISPMFTENISSVGDDGYFLFFEAYNNLATESFIIDVNYRLGSAAELQEQLRFEKRFPKGRSQQWLYLPSGGMPRGNYLVEVTAYDAGDTSTARAAAQRTVQFQGDATNLPISEAELGENIDRLRYVATQDEIDHIRAGASYAERRRAYSEFWQALDPTPRTPENEAMDEYFGRIRQANERFRQFAAGWLTDMGRVFVIFGQPDRIETDPFRSDGKQTQTWHYYGLNRQFTFIDDSGFGDYRLLTPLGPGVKYRYGY